MGHAEDVLALLDGIRCEKCGAAAARGATMCVPCIEALPAVGPKLVFRASFGPLAPPDGDVPDWSEPAGDRELD